MNIEKCTKCNVEYDPIFGHRVCPDCRKKEDRIRTIGLKAKAFCQSHGLNWDSSEDGWITVGQSGFNALDIDSNSIDSSSKVGTFDEDQLRSELEQCLEEHKEIEAIEWRDGLLYECLYKVNDDPTKSAIEDELAALLPRDVLNKIARVFYKYTR